MSKPMTPQQVDEARAKAAGRLTPRWYPLIAHPEQMRLINSTARFRVVPAGRRSGKTERAKRFTVRKAIRAPIDLPHVRDPRFFLAAPTRDQAKRIFWADLKAMIPLHLLARAPSESELFVQLINGATISVIGMDKPERIEGNPWDGGVLDEYANMKKKAWTDHVRPALSTLGRPGWCWLTGVPEGRNHYYDIWKDAISGVDPDMAGFTWKSADLLPADEIAAAKRQLDELTYLQEYEGSFVSFEGRAYYNFQEDTHCVRLHYDPQETLALCFDFNVDPGVAVICQEQRLPTGETGTGIIGEVHIPRNSNTLRVADKLIEDWGDHKGPVRLYGDASGGARGSAKVMGSDWDLLEDKLRPVFGSRLSMRVPSANPAERVRLNAMNSRMKSMDGTIRLMVDPVQAPNMVKDLEGVSLVEGGAGEIDKKATPQLTHLSDALGYYVVYEFPVARHESKVLKIKGF